MNPLLEKQNRAANILLAFSSYFMHHVSSNCALNALSKQFLTLADDTPKIFVNYYSCGNILLVSTAYLCCRLCVSLIYGIAFGLGNFLIEVFYAFWKRNHLFTNSIHE